MHRLKDYHLIDFMLPSIFVHSLPLGSSADRPILTKTSSALFTPQTHCGKLKQLQTRHETRRHLTWSMVSASLLVSDISEPGLWEQIRSWITKKTIRKLRKLWKSTFQLRIYIVLKKAHFQIDLMIFNDYSKDYSDRKYCTSICSSWLYTSLIDATV